MDIGTSSTVHDALPKYLTYVQYTEACMQSRKVFCNNSQKLSICKICMKLKLTAYYQFRNPAPSRILNHSLRFRWYPRKRIAGRFSKNERGIILKKSSLGTEV